MDCSSIDGAVSSVSDSIVHNDIVFGIVCGIISIASLLLLLYGKKVIRFVAAVAGAAAGLIVTFVLSGTIEFSCEARLAVAAASGLIVGILALCIFKSGLFLLGGLGAGAITYLTWESLPLDWVTGPFTIEKRPGWFYITIFIGGLMGAVLSQFNKKTFTLTLSCLAGGVGISSTVYLVFDRFDMDISSLILLLIAIGVTFLGIVVQTHITVRKKSLNA